jgi:hypothetical protein
MYVIVRRRGQLEKIGTGQGGRWKFAPMKPDLI